VAGGSGWGGAGFGVAAAATEWRLLSHQASDGTWNMAVDEAIARSVGTGQAPPTVRFYAWHPRTVSLGFLQRADGAVAVEACRRLGVAVVRRPTGGRAVLHDRELTYSLCLPLDDVWGRLTVAESFRLTSQGLLAGLRRLGVPAVLADGADESRTAEKTEACFQLRRMPAILVRGRKLLGSAQRRWNTVLLQHGSLLIDVDVGIHQRVFPTWTRDGSTDGVTGLTAVLADVPPRAVLETALLRGWREVLGVSWQPAELTAGEREEAERLVRMRYGDPVWTWRR
jgi:lipoate-protein ligase A